MLSTRQKDPGEGAKSFYGSVFGWTTLALDAGEMWTLRGYGDHLERDNPGLREQIAAMGGPAGFEDVVASINAIPADQTDTPSHSAECAISRRPTRMSRTPTWRCE